MGWDHYTDDESPRYEPVAAKRKKAEDLARSMSDHELEPAVVKGTKLAGTFWGQAWNRNLEQYQHYENRLPKGRSLVRNSAVLDLKVTPGCITALVSGTNLYEVTINIKPLQASRWQALKQECTGQIASLVGLLQGKLPPSVMEAVTRPDEGLFPEARDIQFICSCTDDADLCIHAAAAAYGIGARLDERPDLLFLLRGVDHTELITTVGDAAVAQADSVEAGSELGDLSGLFGVDIDCR